ncbi:aspartate dehydrogenase [Salinigranum halophilum]|uniref:aspartate dehydrogenase n=1 Tax=Salinigranum halophilum TaxID=2565931 RepID=UPI0010A7B80D|nr:aspartate dehydrogenase [Salinigranum halophilum]
MKLAVGIFGYGTIGREVLAAIADGSIPDSTLGGVYDRHPERVDEALRSVEHLDETARCDDPLDLAATCDVVLECASHSAVERYAVPLLETGTDLLVLSVGALADADLHDDVCRAAAASGARFEVPSGALAGVDAIKGAAVHGQLDEVVFTTIKPPNGLSGAPHIEDHDIDLAAIEEKQLVFEGSAREAAPAFPANINVAMALSLAGLGADDTVVKIFADPDETDNVHIIEAHGGAGSMEFAFHTKPHPDNPKTSYIAALSAIASLQRRTAPLVVGT